ncbi:DUF1320 domain-containing protein [Acinetobacter sp. ULE_I001]|uniref:gp436 family protein n=1 Tax=Acinetobacter TaxID=469 RepID=UPI0028D1F5CE|nr:DUF1320 domain-containing protein [Acinetobacter guillouiae]
MSKYASREDMVIRYSKITIEQLERGLTADLSVESFIEDASDIADGYIGKEYSIPLPEVPKNLKIMICEIARYLLHRNKAPDEVRDRYEDAISFLKRVSEGKAVLTIAKKNEDGSEDVVVADTSPKTLPIGTTYKGGVFADSVLDMMPSVK